MRLLVLGASGTVGRPLCDAALSRGHTVVAQSRSPATRSIAGVEALVADPMDGGALNRAMSGTDAVIYALGFRGRGDVRFFSETTRVMLEVMSATGVRRLVAITGVGAGETRGHGGFLYDRIVFPLITRPIYVDKDRQEALIRASATDWTLLRPAPFAATPGAEPFHALTDVRGGTRLSRVTPQEVAAMALDCVEKGLYRKAAVFFGHGVSG